MDDLPYDIGDMFAGNGQSYQTEFNASVYQMCLSISDDLEKSTIFQTISNFIPLDKLRLYLEFAVATEIYPVHLAKYVAEWHQKRSIQQSHSIYWQNHKGLGSLVNHYWTDNDLDLKLGCRRNIFEVIKKKIRPIHNKIGYLNWRIAYFLRHLDHPKYNIPEGPNVLVKYSVGIHPHGRNDLFWLNTDITSHGNHIVYFGDPVGKYGIGDDPKQLLELLRSMNIPYVSLDSRNIREPNCPVIPRPWGKGELLTRFNSYYFRADTDSEKWLIDSLEEWLSNIDYWVSVYERLNAKIHVDISSGSSIHIAQNIALDIVGGIKLAWQRSEFLPHYECYVGWYPCHVFMAWNSRSDLPLTQNRSRVGSIIITGISDASLFDQRFKETASRIGSKGINEFFTVALFDNMFFRDDIFSKAMIIKFYTAFLEWVLEDEKVAVINKPKRSIILERLPELHKLMHRAQATGRWINLVEKHRQSSSIDHIPIDASCRADISVGIGISSAVTETIAYGSKGIYCDLPIIKDHPFYEWGYNQVVFNEIELMMTSLKRYQSDTESQSLLGNFESHMDQIDPFHDGKQPERVASYLDWLVDGYRQGLARNQIISQANNKYSDIYGSDKVIEKMIS